MKDVIRVPAIEFQQLEGQPLYSFAVDGKLLPHFASVSRVGRDSERSLQGYQRPEVVRHITSIREYIESSSPMVPNSLVIAFDSRVTFEPSPEGDGIEGNRVAVAGRGGIVGHGNPDHVLISSRPELAVAVFLPPAGIGDQDNFGPVKHQNAGAFRKLPVIADHRPDFDLSVLGIQGADTKAVARCQLALDIEFAGMHFGVGHEDLAMPVDDRNGIAGRAVPPLPSTKDTNSDPPLRHWRRSHSSASGFWRRCAICRRGTGRSSS